MQMHEGHCRAFVTLIARWKPGARCTTACCLCTAGRFGWLPCGCSGQSADAAADIWRVQTHGARAYPRAGHGVLRRCQQPAGDCSHSCVPPCAPTSSCMIDDAQHHYKICNNGNPLHKLRTMYQCALAVLLEFAMHTACITGTGRLGLWEEYCYMQTSGQHPKLLTAYSHPGKRL